LDKENFKKSIQQANEKIKEETIQFFLSTPIFYWIQK